jgi:hypothetical protein
VSKDVFARGSQDHHLSGGTTVNRLIRASAAFVAAGLAVPLWAAPASAATLAETASVGAYYLASNPGTVTAPALGPQKLPDNAKNTDQVAQDDLAVAVVAANTGKPDKFSALMWDLIDLVPDATVSKATFTIPFSTKPESRSTEKTPGLVVACLAGPEGFGDADGEPTSDAPSAMCAEGSATATSVEGGNALEFDITAIAQKWTETNTGLVLYPSKTGFAKPFQMVFADKNQARLTVAFTAPAVEELVIDDAELGNLPGSSSTDVGTTGTPGTPGTAGTFDSGATGFDAGGGSVSGGSFGSGTLSTPTLSAPTLEAPAVAGQPQAGATQPIARAGSVGNLMALDALTWAALLGGAALLALVSLTLGAPAATAGTRQAVRPGGVASALAQRGAAFGSFGPRPV